MPKLLIWDLDDTLWTGTLAEGDSLTPRTELFEKIRILNSQGIVNAICSKNDFDKAKAKLEELGYWDLFVFPRIAFVPKGRAVEQLLIDMSLRAPDVVFIDDNPLNRNEVTFTCENITVKDPNSEDFPSWIDGVVSETSGVKKDRVKQYRILEAKLSDKTQSTGSNEDFLRSCDIRVAVVERARNFNFAGRLEELVNRTNQLNFTKSRMAVGTMEEYVSSVSENLTYSLFAWDKYGYYGLVGFAGVSNRGDNLEHFLFSCRTMNMGVERALAAYIKEKLPNKNLKFPVSSELPDWITIVSSSSDEFQEKLAKDESFSGAANPSLRIMANCQSGPIAHYAGITPVDTDAWPDIFSLQDLIDGNILEKFPPLVVYGAFQDYDANYWKAGKVPSCEEYQIAVEKLISKLDEDDSALLVILPPSEFTRELPERGQTTEVFRSFNAVWEEVASQNDNVELTHIGALAGDHEDPRHFDRTTLTALGEEVLKFYNSHEADQKKINRSTRVKSKDSHLLPFVEISSNFELYKGTSHPVWDNPASSESALNWEIEISGVGTDFIEKTNVFDMTFDLPDQVRGFRDGVVRIGETDGFFKYFGNEGEFHTRFVVSGEIPVSLRSMSIRAFGNFSETQRTTITSIRVWRHK